MTFVEALNRKNITYPGGSAPLSGAAHFHVPSVSESVSRKYLYESVTLKSSEMRGVSFSELGMPSQTCYWIALDISKIRYK